MTDPVRSVQIVARRDRAELLMHPLRTRILEAARQPGSAADLARRLEMKPQKVNYHIRRLADHGFLHKVEERRAGNVVETVYASVADSYVLASGVLGGLAPDVAEAEAGTAAHWLSLQARAEAELARALEQREVAGEGDETFAMDAEFRFESAEQRDLFVRTVRELVGAVVSKYTSPMRTPDGGPGPGPAYRLLLGCYPTGGSSGGADAG